MRTFQFQLPHKMNDGGNTTVQRRDAEACLLDAFNGYTDLGEVRGAWRDDDGTVYHDVCTRYEVATDDYYGLVEFLTTAAVEFKQVCIYLVEVGEADFVYQDGLREVEPDVDDDFPMSLEYDGLYGASDFEVEQAAQREAEYENFFTGDYAEGY